MLQRKKFLQAALRTINNDVDDITYALSRLRMESTSVEEKLACLDLIRNNIDEIDIANSFVKTGGISDLLEYIRKPNHELRSPSIYIVAEMAQNNVFCQKYFLTEKMIPLITSTMNDPDEDLARGSIYAISSLIQNFLPALMEFVRIKGLIMLLSCLSSSHGSVYIKAAYLIGSLSSNNKSIKGKLILLVIKNT